MKKIYKELVEKDIKRVASILRRYKMYSYIDFVSRSGAAEGTIEWSEYVARFLYQVDKPNHSVDVNGNCNLGCC